MTIIRRSPRTDEYDASDDYRDAVPAHLRRRTRPVDSGDASSTDASDGSGGHGHGGYTDRVDPGAYEELDDGDLDDSTDRHPDQSAAERRFSRFLARRAREPSPRRFTGPWARRTQTVASHGRALFLALTAGALAALVSLLIIAIPVAVAWFADERSGASLAETSGVAMNLWALAHRGVIDASGVQLVFAPLLLTLIPFALCRYAVGQVLVDRPGRGTGDIRGFGAAWRALGGTELVAFTAGYLIAGTAWCYLAGFGQAPVQVGTAVPGLLLVPLAAIAFALWKEHRAGERASENPLIARALSWIEAHTPVLIRRGLRPAIEAVIVLLVGGTLIMMAMLLMQAERIGAVYGVVETGPAGAVVLTIAQLAALPNIAMWAAAWSAGTPVEVGSTSISWSESTAGDLPLVPIFAGFPEAGPMPDWTWVMVSLPVLAGAWVGWRAVQATPRLASWWTKAQIALSSCLGAGLVVLVLAWLSTGGLTPGRLGTIGVDVWLATGLITGWVAAGAVTAITVLHLTRRRVRRR